MTHINNVLCNIFDNYIFIDLQPVIYDLDDFYKDLQESNTKLSSLTFEQASVIYQILLDFIIKN
jgi:hypothetical protein